MKVKNYFRFRNKKTGEIREAWCRSHNWFHFCTQRNMVPSDWRLEESIVWDKSIFNKTF